MLEMVIEAQRKDLGGFEVGRILPIAKKRMVGPFVFLDHMGPADFSPDQGIDVRAHPHIGLSTLTYLFEGEIRHQDSLGFDQIITPGEVNWMTAGRGITHSERTPANLRKAGAKMEGLQAWIALPTEHEETQPSFSNHKGADLPCHEGDGGLWTRWVAGEAFGVRAQVKAHSPLFYLHWQMPPGSRAVLPTGYFERAIYVVRGQILYDGGVYHPGQMLVFGRTDQPVIVAQTAATVVALGGEPLGPRYMWWNFVSSSQDRIQQAKADWQAGRFALPPLDGQEFIPLPEG